MPTNNTSPFINPDFHRTTLATKTVDIAQWLSDLEIWYQNADLTLQKVVVKYGNTFSTTIEAGGITDELNEATWWVGLRKKNTLQNLKS